MSHVQELQRLCADLPNGDAILALCKDIQIQSVAAEREACGDVVRAMKDGEPAGSPRRDALAEAVLAIRARK